MKRYLKTKKTLKIKICRDKDGTIWLNTREVAAVLGIKQPFEFSAHIRDFYDVKSLFTKNEIGIKNPAERGDAVYVQGISLLAYLESGNLKQKCDLKNKKLLIEELRNLEGEE